MADKIQRIPVWNGLLRLAHWSIALSTLFLIATGLLIDIAPTIADAAIDWHQIVGALFSIALILRLWLLFFDHGNGHWSALVPKESDIATIKEMLLYYLTLGKRKLPRWYAHNPLWMPIYLLMLVIFAGLSLTGHFLENTPILFGFYLPSLHLLFAKITVVFAIFHIIAVFFHDLKGTGSDISAMINGYRIFVVEPVDTIPGGDAQQVSVNEILKPKKRNEEEIR